MADPLSWKPGEGYDIHVLRGGPASRALGSTLSLPANHVPSTLSFVPQVGGSLSKFGLTVNSSTGEVTAAVLNSSQSVINNFLMTVSVQDSSSKKFETEIRVHLHDSVTDIWLTPSTLTIHKGTDECRFTVLASFTHGVLGDITDSWPLSWKSLAPSTTVDSTDILVTPGGVLKALTPDKSATIKVTLTLPGTPSRTFTAEATAKSRPSWDDLSAKATVNFVVAGLRRPGGGTVVPNKDDPNSANRDSVSSVVANALNVLFVSEGFSRETDFNNLVNQIVTDLRTQDYLQPFKLVQDSINYWSVFVPSQDDGISLLGEFVAFARKPPPGIVGIFLHQPIKPPASSTTWTLEQMIHEVGLPVANDPATLTAIKDVWKARYGDKAYQTLAAASFVSWRNLALPPNSWRSVLNERDTAFGLRNCDRSRAAPTFSEVMLGSDESRRTRDATIFKFIAGLNYGRNPLTFATYNLGSAWKDGTKDAGLLCFLCQTQKHAGIRWGGYFLSSTGRSASINLKVTKTPKGASALEIDHPPLSSGDQTLLATVVAHEFGHALGLADEYGDGGGKQLQSDPRAPNLLDKNVITTTTVNPPPGSNITVYDKTQEIKWLWPRITKAGVLSGIPHISGNGLRVPLQKGHGKPFIFQEIVRFRETPVRVAPSQDPFVAYPPLSFLITAHDDDGVNVVLGHPGGAVLDVNFPISNSSDQRPWGEVFLAMFKPGVRYALICPRRRPGAAGGFELKLMSEKILMQVLLTNGPLNAPPGNEGVGHETAVCAAVGGNGSKNMTPTNLPEGFGGPLSIAALSDIIGIYEGGAHADCGVFRPAGRCKMRGQFEQGIPFCHVCRYLIVDKVDPTKHGELDDLYDPHYPK